MMPGCFSDAARMKENWFWVPLMMAPWWQTSQNMSSAKFCWFFTNPGPIPYQQPPTPDIFRLSAIPVPPCPNSGHRIVPLALLIQIISQYKTGTAHARNQPVGQ